MLHPWVREVYPCYTRGYGGCCPMYPGGYGDAAYVPGWVWWVCIPTMLPGGYGGYTALPTMPTPCTPGYTMVHILPTVPHILPLMVSGCGVMRPWAQDGE